MIRSIECLLSAFASLAIVYYSLEISIQYVLFNVIIKLMCPVKSTAHSPVYQRKVVDHVSTSDYQYAFFSQFCELSSCLKVGLRSCVKINAQLNDRYVCIRIHPAKHRPGTMVYAPPVVCNYAFFEQI